MTTCHVPFCDDETVVDGLCGPHAMMTSTQRAESAATLKAENRRPVRSALATAQTITAKQAWRVLIADPTDENRAIFVAACERAR